MDHTGRIGPIDAVKIAKHRKTDPEAFLSRLSIVAEGATEKGFAAALLERAFGSPLEQHGVHVSNGNGHEASLGVLEALAAGGLRFGEFADDESKYPGRWRKLHDKLGPLLFRWPSLCIEPNIVGVVPDEKLEDLIVDPDGLKTGMRLRQLAERLALQEKDFTSIRNKAGANFKVVIVEAALGSVPAGKESEKNEYKAHASTWFKSVEGGRELAGKVFALGVWSSLKPQLLPFCNAVRAAVGLAEIVDMPQ